jgi:hypothetical protein
MVPPEEGSHWAARNAALRIRKQAPLLQPVCRSEVVARGEIKLAGPRQDLERVRDDC